MKSYLRTEVGERIDQPDLQYGVETAPRDALAEALTSLLTSGRNVARTAVPKSYILRGFTVRHGGGSVYVVEKDDLTGEGAAVLSFRDKGEVKYGCVLAGGQPRKQIDISSYAAGTYGLYVRLEFRDADYGNRLFWNATAATPVEYPRAIATRRAADWAITVELTQPGPEWIKIADVTQAGAAPTDRRQFFFEGTDADSNLVTDAEWGDSDDRSNFREVDGIFSLRRFVRATQRLLQDIKADGVGWWVTPAKGLAELLDLTGTRSMQGPLNPDATNAYNIGVSNALRWNNIFAARIDVDNAFPSAAGGGQIGDALAPYGFGWFQDSVLSTASAVRGARVGGGSLEINDAALGAVQLLMNELLAGGQADADMARILVDNPGDSFMEIQSGLFTAEGTRSLRLNATDVRLARNCEGQNGLEYLSFQNASSVNALANQITSQTTTVAPTNGDITTADAIIGWSERGSSGSTFIRAVDMYISGTNQITVDFVNPDSSAHTSQPTFTIVVLRR